MGKLTESVKSGQYFSNFYGGAAVRSVHLDHVRDRLEAVKLANNLHGELKWQKVTKQYLDKYISVMDELFDLVAGDLVKIRIMFTSNQHVPVGLTAEQREHSYFLLYYQFIKHAFGLEYAPVGGGPMALRLYFDKLPDSREKAQRFIGFILGLDQRPEFKRAGICIPRDQVAQVISHDHVIMQALDIVLGSMQFRLNDQHLVKPEGVRTRGSRTIAKHKLYKHINKRIRDVYPGFNIGCTLPASVRHFPPKTNRHIP